MTPVALPPENPPPPVPRKRPFQFAVGIAIQMRTLSPAGGCVVVAMTRQRLGFAASTVADSIVVSGSATFARLSHDRTGLAFAMSGLGGFWAWPAMTSTVTMAVEAISVRRNRVMSSLAVRNGAKSTVIEATISQ